MAGHRLHVKAKGQFCESVQSFHLIWVLNSHYQASKQVSLPTEPSHRLSPTIFH